MATPKTITKSDALALLGAIISQAPGATVPGVMPEWLSAAVASAPKAGPVARTFKRAPERDGVSKSGNPYTVYVAATRNGGTFPCMVPTDLVAQIKAGL